MFDEFSGQGGWFLSSTRAEDNCVEKINYNRERTMSILNYQYFIE
jgi:hypothetical protein